jgi:hypothetical protein
LRFVADADDSDPGGALPATPAALCVKVTASFWADARRRQATSSRSGAGRERKLGMDVICIDAYLDQRRQSCELEHWQRAGAGGDHGAFEAGMAGGLEVATRSGEGGHSMLPQPS